MVKNKNEDNDSRGNCCGSSDIIDVELLIPPLPVFDNPAYESSDADLESINNTINSTKSLKSVMNECNNSEVRDEDDIDEDEKSNTSYSISRKNSKVPLDPIEDLRNLAREISPGVTVTLTKSLETQLLRLNTRNDITRFPVILTPVDFSSSSTLPTSSSSSTPLGITRNNKKEKMSDSDISYIGSGSSNYSTKNNNFILVNNNKNYYGGKNEVEIFLDKTSCRTYYGFTQRQWSILIIFAFTNAMSAMCISLLLPFYPAEAKSKGASDTENGFVFGCFELTVFIMSPLFGKYMSRIGPRNAFNYGILTTGVCSFIFGFLTYVDNRFAFISLSFIIRVVSAVGAAAQVTASFTLIAIEFTDNVFTIFAAMETSTGVGLILGPLVGSVLFKIGQFMLPFSALGGLLFIGAFLAFLTMPKTSSKKINVEEESLENGQGFIKVMTIPSVALAALSICTAAISLGFNGPLLDEHIDRFELDAVAKGFIFIINGGTYAVTATFWGRLCDKTKQSKYLTLLGAGLIFFGFILIGPASFLPFDTVLWVTCVGLFIQGLGLGAAFVSGFTQGLRASIESGFPENVGTFGLISGMWMSMFALGNFIGPSVSGVLKDLVGYREGSLFVMAVQLLVVGITLVFILNERRNGNGHINKNSELEIHDGNGIAVKEAKFFTSEFSDGFDSGIPTKLIGSNPMRSVDKIV